MKIINNKAAAALYEKAKEISHRSSAGWKCIYFKAPDAEERMAHSFPKLDTGVVVHLLAKAKGFAYFCENGEIFILYRGTMDSLVSRLSIYLWALYPERIRMYPSHKLFSLFDLGGKDWDSFYALCRKRHLESLADAESRFLFPSTGSFIPVVQQEHVAGYLRDK